MAKHYVLASFISIVISVALVLVLLLISVPQIESLSSDVVPSYSKINSEEFAFIETKHFVTEILSKKYTIDTNDITNYQNNKQYRPGNYDPFTPEEKVKESIDNSSQEKAEENNTNSNSNSSGDVISGITK